MKIVSTEAICADGFKVNINQTVVLDIIRGMDLEGKLLNQIVLVQLWCLFCPRVSVPQCRDDTCKALPLKSNDSNVSFHSLVTPAKT